MTNDSTKNKLLNELKHNEQGKQDNSDSAARTKIIESAAVLFAENGFEGTSTRDIAQKSGMNISMISYYFGGKEGLYKEVIKTFALGAKGVLESILAQYELNNLDKENFKKLMKSIIDLMLQFKVSKPHFHLILKREEVAGLPYARETYENIFTGVGESIVSIYKAGQDRGYIRKDINPYFLFLSLVHSTDALFIGQSCQTTIIRKCPDFNTEIEVIATQVFKIFVEGVLI